MLESDIDTCPICGGHRLQEMINYETFLGHPIKDYYIMCMSCNAEMAFDEQATKNKEEVIRVKGLCVV